MKLKTITKKKPDDKKTSRLRILLNILRTKVFYSNISIGITFHLIHMFHLMPQWLG